MSNWKRLAKTTASLFAVTALLILAGLLSLSTAVPVLGAQAWSAVGPPQPSADTSTLQAASPRLLADQLHIRP